MPMTNQDANKIVAKDNDKTPRESIPNKAFDSEYMTEWVREVKFLADKGIKYTFVKKTPVYNIKQYKYTKTPELFVALAEFYYQTMNEKAYNRLNRAISETTELPEELASRLSALNDPKNCTRQVGATFV